MEKKKKINKLIEPNILKTEERPESVKETEIKKDNTEAKLIDDKIKVDYYNTTYKKVIDFLMGFGLNLAIAFILTVIFLLLSSYAGVYAVLMTLLLISTYILLLIFLCIKFFIRRRYIAIGMIVSIIVPPLLLFGTCMVLLFSGGLSGL